MEQWCLHCQAVLCIGSWPGDWDYCCWVTRAHTTPQTDLLLTGAATAATSLLSPSGLMALGRNPLQNAPGLPYNGNQTKVVGNSQGIHCRESRTGCELKCQHRPTQKTQPQPQHWPDSPALESQSRRFSTVWAVSDVGCKKARGACPSRANK